MAGEPLLIFVCLVFLLEGKNVRLFYNVAFLFGLLAVPNIASTVGISSSRPTISNGPCSPAVPVQLDFVLGEYKPDAHCPPVNDRPDVGHPVGIQHNIRSSMYPAIPLYSR